MLKITVLFFHFFLCGIRNKTWLFDTLTLGALFLILILLILLLLLLLVATLVTFA